MLGLKHSSSLVGCSGQRLDPSDSIALMLIPSALSTSFMVVCEHGLSSYSNVLGKVSARKSVSLPRESLNDFKSSSAAPLWIQWARPQRHILRRGTHDDFYLCREDGLVHFIEVQKSFDQVESIRIALHFNTGPLHCNVDRAFAVMTGSLHDVADILLAAGDMSDGGVYQCMPRDSPSCSQIISNWAPVIDMLTIRDKSEGELGKDRLFVCSGRGEGLGAVSELRSGLEAKVGLIVPQPDAASMDGLWVLPDIYREQFVLLTAHPLHTTGLLLDPGTEEVEALDEHSVYGFELGATTLAAGVLNESISFQVTPSEIVYCSISPGPAPVSRVHSGAQTFSHAVVIDYILPTVITVSEETEDGALARLCVRQFQQREGSLIELILEESMDLTTRPMALCVRQSDMGLNICIGTAQGTVAFFLLKDTKVIKAGEVELAYDATPGDSRFDDLRPAVTPLIDSVALLNADEIRWHPSLVLCGLRDGHLISAQIVAERSGATGIIGQWSRM